MLKGKLKISNISNLSSGKSIPSQNVLVPNKTELEKFKYDYESGENLYRVNCSFCHGNEGLGDGPAKEYIISENSYYSTNKVEGLPGSGSGTPYISPPQLNDIEERYGNMDSAYKRIYQMLNSEIGFGPMPGFLRVLSEEERKQIIEFILDKDNGLNK